MNQPIDIDQSANHKTSYPFFVQCDENGQQIGYFDDKNNLVTKTPSNKLFDDLFALEGSSSIKSKTNP